MRGRRYQLRKDAVAIVEGGHPWLFREQMSSAAHVFAGGELLRLVDGANRVVAHGVYEAEGAIAIRIVRRGPEPPGAAWIRDRLAAALARRSELVARTDAIRLVHGESDELPAIVVDRFADTLVVSSYSAGTDARARFVARTLAAHAPAPVAQAGSAQAPAIAAAGAAASHAAIDDHLTPPVADTLRSIGDLTPAVADLSRSIVDVTPAVADLPRSIVDLTPRVADLPLIVGPARHVVLRPALRRRGGALPARTLRGEPPGVVRFREDGVDYAVDLAGGQKTGTYLDLRGLRRDLAAAPLAGARVLNLFAYSGMLGLAAEHAGAAAIVQVDASERALAFAAAHHVRDAARHRFVTADAFAWVDTIPAEERFDLVIVDPPSMTSKKAQVPKALAAYRHLYAAVAARVAPGGAVVAACCTSRIERPAFHKVVREGLGPAFTRERELAPELDHPVAFPQADYLKIAFWRRAR